MTPRRPAPGKRVPRRLLLAAALLLAGALLAWAFRPRDNRLLRLATPVLSGLKHQRAAHHYWLDDHRLLLFPESLDPAGVTVLDSATGRSTPAAPLARALAAARADGLEPHALSDDRKWLLWEDAADFGATTLDGTRTVRWKRHRLPEERTWGDFYLETTVWLPGGREWLYMFDPSEGPERLRPRIYSLDDPAGTLAPPVHPDPDFDTPVGFLADGRMLMASVLNRKTPIGSVRLRAFDVRDPRAAPTAWTVRLPTGTTLAAEVVLSPDHRRLAWQLLLEDEVSEPAWWRWVRRRMGEDPPAFHMALWVSGLRGEELHEIGRIETPPQKVTDDPGPSHVRWLPDGRRLSFVNDGTLYTVPTD